MTIDIDKSAVENRLDYMKTLAERGGSHNKYPEMYENFKETLEFIGICVEFKDGYHVISIM